MIQCQGCTCAGWLWEGEGGLGDHQPGVYVPLKALFLVGNQKTCFLTLRLIWAICFLPGCSNGTYGSECDKVCDRCQDKACNRDDGTCGMFCHLLKTEETLRKIYYVIYREFLCCLEMKNFSRFFCIFLIFPIKH